MPETWVPAQDLAALFGPELFDQEGHGACFAPRCWDAAGVEGVDCELRPTRYAIAHADEWRKPCLLAKLHRTVKHRFAWLPSGRRELQFSSLEIYKIAAALNQPVPPGYPTEATPPEPAPPELWMMMPPEPRPSPPFAPVGAEAPPRLAHGDQSVVDTAIQRHQAAPLKSVETFADPDWRQWR